MPRYYGPGNHMSVNVQESSQQVSVPDASSGSGTRKIYTSSAGQMKPKKSEKLKKHKTKLKPWQKVVFIILGILLIVCVAFAIYYWKKDLEIQSKWDELKVISDEDYDDTTKMLSYLDDDPMNRMIDWDALHAINEDIIAWIYIPDTSIDYPILQEPSLVTNGDYYYLHKDIYKKYDYMGCILTPKEPDGCDDLEMHLQVFGHHMIGKQMFGNLDKYKTYDFYAEQPYVYLYYPDRTERWQVWAAMSTSVSDMVYKMPYEYGTQEYKDLIDHIEDNKLYTTSVGTVTNEMRTLTLSTCRGQTGGTLRFTVNCVINQTKWIDEESEEQYERLQQEREQERMEQNQRDYQNGEWYDTFDKSYDSE